MATTNYREDYLGRDLQAPTVAALDSLGRATTSTVDAIGRPLRRILRANDTAYTAGTEIQFSGGSKYTVKIAGTTDSSAPAVPAVGADVVDGTATLTRTK